MLKRVVAVILAVMMISAVSAMACGAEKATKAEKTSAETYSCNSNTKGATNTAATAGERSLIQNAAAMSDSKSCADLGKDAKSACVKSDAADVKSTSADKSGSYVSKSADITTASSTSEKSQCPYMKATTASSGDTDATIQTAAAKSADQTGTSCHGSKQPTTQTASDKDVITTTDKTAMIDKK